MYNQKKNNLGRVYVKYLDPLNLHQYLFENLNVTTLDQKNYEQVALKLTQELMLRQQRETYVTLNSLISACII